MRPPFAYYGGKVGMSARIVAMLPPHRVYLEPFFGSGAVFFAKSPARHEIINDADRNIVNFFKVLREQPEELERICALTPHARAEYDAADLMDELDELERARRFWVRVNQSFAKTASTQTGWSVTTARTQSVPEGVRSRIRRFAAVAERLAGVTIEQCDAADLIERLATPDTAIYVDPPYLATTRSNRFDRRPTDYGVDMGMDADHRRLAEVLHATSGAVLLSGYHSPLYDELYGEWDRVEVNVTAHSSNAVTAGRTGRVEVIWSNRPLHDGRFAFDVRAEAAL